MKKIFLSGLLLSGLLAQNITLKSGWQLLGSAQEIDVKAFDDSGCVVCLWKYDFLDKHPWKLHISNGMENKTSFEDFFKIKKGEGFWANISEDNCTISLNENNITQKDYIPKGKDITDRIAVRFLNKATFGATTESVKHLKEIGIEKWIEEQLSMEPSSQPYLRKTIELGKGREVDRYKASVEEYLADNGIIFNDGEGSSRAMDFVTSAWFTHALLAKDQLHHKLTYALSQIIVEGIAFNVRAEAYANYFDVLYKYAFDKYANLLEAISHDPGMGMFLTYCGNKKLHNNKNGVPVYPDENYAREIMQLFSIGLKKLNMDGTPILDQNGREIPTYTQQDVNELARVFTGWDLRSPRDFTHPLSDRKAKDDHDFGEKKLLGQIIPANLTPTEDIKRAVDIIMLQDSVAPYLAKKLIMRLTKSNPSSQYIYRVATVFKKSNYDIKEATKAILLDPELWDDLRADKPIKFKEPIIGYTQMLRAMHTKPLLKWYYCYTGGPQDANYKGCNVVHNQLHFTEVRTFLGQSPGRSPTVFNFYSDSYIPNHPEFKKNKLYAPETQIQSAGILVRFSKRIFEDLLYWERGFMVEQHYPYIDENGTKRLHFYTSILDFANQTYRANNLMMYYIGMDKMLLDASEEYKLLSQIIDGDDKEEYRNLKDYRVKDYHDDEKALRALIEFENKKLTGGRMTKAQEDIIYNRLKNIDIFNKDQESDKNRPWSKKYQLYRKLIIPVIHAIVVSDTYMVE